jgi:hypothetical protein
MTYIFLDVLNVAARWGRPDLATQALAKLSELNVQAQEYHLVALLESYVVAGRVPEALRVGRSTLTILPKLVSPDLDDPIGRPR